MNPISGMTYEAHISIVMGDCMQRYGDFGCKIYSLRYLFLFIFLVALVGLLGSKWFRKFDGSPKNIPAGILLLIGGYALVAAIWVGVTFGREGFDSILHFFGDWFYVMITPGVYFSPRYG